MTDESVELVILKAIYRKLSDIKDILQIKGAVATTLADFSKAPKEINTYTKAMLGGYTIAAKGCNKCGGKITWDNYDKDGGHAYPDHVDDDGNIIDCPEYNY